MSKASHGKRKTTMTSEETIVMEGNEKADELEKN